MLTLVKKILIHFTLKEFGSWQKLDFHIWELNLVKISNWKSKTEEGQSTKDLVTRTCNNSVNKGLKKGSK